MEVLQKIKYERPVIKQLNAGITNKFGAQTGFIPHTHIDGVAVKDLMAKYGSPLFVISERSLRQTYQEAYNAFANRYPNVQFAWSYKTNYMNAVCRVFHQEGSWAEVVSRFEYEKALGNGVPGDKIIFNGPDKTADDHRVAVQNNSPIHIDHFDELYGLMEVSAKLGKRPKVAIRVNMDTGVQPMWDRFGFNYESGQAWDAITKIIQTDKMDLVGLHCHIGTFMLSTNAYAVAASKMADLALNVKRQFGIDIQYLDLGGGFASKNTLKGAYLSGTDITPSFHDYAEQICTTLIKAGFRSEELPLLILETGRALVDDAGYLLGTVLANKRLSDGRRATIMDFGVNLLFTSFWYEHAISPAQDCSQYAEDAVLYGPLCMNIDVVRESVKLPPLNKGDQVVVHRVGAYNMTQWMQFISLRPNIVLIDMDGQPHLIRKHETVGDLTQLELTPTHLESFDL
ncbi:type III PLP-dependent enzyme domain-containing protein [Spirosoma aerolatum]|uniref:diaminopimelate decarboxylase n=1 Tax=Spirosoma aerolatum TaxID=1211326 RepID=UPI0009ADFD75|nr:diaminopimelate decarboxylase [Spirosoma aerolatum]